MPYRKVTFPAGINREGTQYSAEGNWFDCDLIRFRQGRPEKIGGWAKYSSNEFLGISRSLMNWSSIDGANLMAVGSDKKLYVELGGVYHDITPMDYKSQGTLDLAMANVSSNTNAKFNFAVSVNDVVRMGSDANAVGDELMTVVSVVSSGAAGEVIVMQRGSCNTTPSAHSVGDAAFLLQKISNPIYLIDNLTTVLIYYPSHGLVSGDFINFLKIGSDPTGGAPVTRDDLYYPAHTSSIDGYDTTKSTQSFPVTKVLTSDYFEIRIATAPSGTGMSNSVLNEDLTASEADITLTASTPAWAAGDVVRIGDEYIVLTTDSGDQLTFTGCLRSQFGSMSADHSSGAAVNEVGSSGSGQGGDTIIMRDIQASESTFAEFSGWGAGTWGGIPTSTTSTTLNGSITDVQTTATVTAGVFGATGTTGTILIESELISYTVDSATTSLNPISREQLGTTKAAHASGTSVFLVDQYWTAWGDPTVPFADGANALNIWSLDTFGEDLVAAKDRSRPYYWNTSLKMSRGYPYSTTSDTSNDYASGIMLADAVPMSSLGLSTDDGHGDVPEEVGFLMTNPASRQVIAFGCSDTFGNFDPMLIRWCDEDHPGSWKMTDQNSAGGAPLQKGSGIIAAARSDRQTLIWTDNALYSLQYTGGDFVFSLQEVADDISIASRHAHKAGRGIVYWMGDNNFYQTDGRSVQKVPCSILSKVFEELNYDKREVVFSAINSLFNEIIWFYPSDESTEPDKYALLNYVDNTWAYGSMPRSSWSDSGLREKPNASYNKGPYDSGVYQSIDRSIIYNHEDGYSDDGSKMNSYIESAYFDIEDGDLSMFADRFAPDFRALGTGSPTLTVDLSAKNYPSSTTPPPKALSFTETTEFINTRLRGRTMSMKFKDNDDTSGAGWELGDSRLRIKPDGRR